MRGKLGLVEYFPDFVQLLHATKVEEIRLSVLPKEQELIPEY
jgi:hypothetical protein